MQSRGIRLVLMLDTSLSRIGVAFEGVNEKVVRLEGLSAHDSARLLVRKGSRRIEPSEVDVQAVCEVIPQLSHHSLIAHLKGHPGAIVQAAALLDQHPSVSGLEKALKSTEVDHTNTTEQLAILLEE